MPVSSTASCNRAAVIVPRRGPGRRDIGHRDRVRDVGLAGSAQLALVRLNGGGPGATDDLDVAVSVVLEETAD